MHGAAKVPVTLSPPAKAPPVDNIGLIALLVGTGIIAWSGVLARFLDVGPLAGAAWRMGLAVPALAVWVRLASRGRASGAPSSAFIFPLVLAGFAFACDVGAFHIALTGTKVANASFIGNVAPILTVAGGALFFTEHPPPRVWFALALALLGSWVMAGMAAPANLGFGDIFALCAAISYATYLLIIERLRSKLDGPTATLWSAAVSAIALAIAAKLHGEVLIPHSALGWTIVVLLGVVSHAIWTRPDFRGDRTRAGRAGRADHPGAAALFRPDRLDRRGRDDEPAANARRRRNLVRPAVGAPELMSNSYDLTCADGAGSALKNAILC